MRWPEARVPPRDERFGTYRRRMRPVLGSLAAGLLVSGVTSGCQAPVHGTGTGPGASPTYRVEYLASSAMDPQHPSDTASVQYTRPDGDSRTAEFRDSWLTSVSTDADALRRAGGSHLLLVVTAPTSTGTVLKAHCQIDVNGRTVSANTGVVASCGTVLGADR